jgi:predicted dehydrogenase
LRARLAMQHPAVHYLAVSDRDAAKARDLAQKVDARFHSGDNREVIAHPEVNAVIVSTSEGEHMDAVLQAVALGKPVLVEKPIALTLADADAMVAAIDKAGANVRVGYSRRYKERYLIAKEQIVQGRLGTVVGAAARVYNSRSQGLAVLKRDRHATPVVDALTYYVDLMNWLLGGTAIAEVYARGQKGVLKAAGFDADDVNWAVFTYADGTVVNLGISYALPEKYPALGHAARVEVLGTDGVMILDDDHTDQLMYTDKGVPHVYLPDHTVNMVFLQSGTPGDWALGELWGPIANETRAWLDHLAMGKPCVLANPHEARANLEATLAIEHSLVSGKPVTLPLAG